MVDLIFNYDWIGNFLGLIENWLVFFKILVFIILRLYFFMFIFWGFELIIFYNDVFCLSFGNDGKYFGLFGQLGEISWVEFWLVIGLMIYDIMVGGDVVFFEDQKLLIYCEGEIGYVYWMYSFSVIINEDGWIDGLLVNCVEIIRGVEGFIVLEFKCNEFVFVIDVVQFGMWEMNLLIGRFVMNEWFK